MKTYTLSPRLKAIADFAKGKETVADIGCDHGKISVYLAQNGAYVHAVDISRPSLQKAKALAKAENAEDRMSFYCDNGLESIKHIRLDGAIIAGMGWRTIGSILTDNIDCVKAIDTLILQPMDSVIELRSFICSHGFNITDERLVWDEGRLYTVLTAKYICNQKLSLLEHILGPKIIKNNDVLLIDLIEKELKKCKMKLHGLKKAQNKDKELIRQIEKEILILKEEKEKHER